MNDPHAPLAKPTSGPVRNETRRIEGMRLSIVVPAYNEEAVIERFHRRLCDALAPLQLQFEVIYVDDGSTDRTPAILSTCARRNHRSATCGSAEISGRKRLSRPVSTMPGATRWW